METEFSKYHGTGNDFVMIDNRDGRFPKENATLIERLCDRRFGIGGDGLILLENDKSSDFRMVYFNSDGREGSMCGNGGRCVVAFAKQLGLIKSNTDFIAADGEHKAAIAPSGEIALKMQDVSNVDIHADYTFLDTGSPHHIEYVKNPGDVDVKVRGAELRYGGLYGDAGSNINFASQDAADIFSVRTYERGVEDETFSCGTGAVAVAIASHATGRTKSDNIEIRVLGGTLRVKFALENGIYRSVVLSGPATFVYSGKISIS